MKERLPWFRCVPTALLGALAGLSPDEGYVYIVTLLRIYETGAPVKETSRTLSRRSGLPERRVAAALEGLLDAGKLTRLEDGQLDSASTHEEIAWQENVRQSQSAAGKASAAKRSIPRAKIVETAAEEKAQQNQQVEPTADERPFKHKEIEVDITSVSSLRSETSPSPKETKTKTRATRIDPAWRPSEADRAFAVSVGIPGADIAQRAAEFVDYWISIGGEKGRKVDWPATWRNRCRNIADHKGYSPVRHCPPGVAIPQNWPPRLPEPDACFAAWRRGSWPSAWGFPPGDPSCRIPAEIIESWKARCKERAA
ncbi:hypothetical protein ACLBXM_20215 [Xanthobacteraceae bacterium A53D]